VSRNIRGWARGGTVGPLCNQVESRIDGHGQNATGEILVRIPRVMGTYYNRKRETEEAHQDGWFKTGDLGRMDGDHLVFVRELKNTRKVNGNIVDLEEIARAIRLDPDITDVRVGWENGSLFAHLAVSRKIDFDGKAVHLRRFLREILAEYKIPRRFGRL